ncbi:MAG: SDR family oxidoreductase [Sphingomonadales bacterium]|nr:SDR family oxidoreductase [Sphingomonadales bacterium]
MTMTMEPATGVSEASDIPTRLRGKTILVAGGGGIGGGLARRFAAEGANVVLGDVDEASAETIVRGIVADRGRALATRFDGADEVSAAAAVALACERFGGLDGIHCNFANVLEQDDAVGALELPLADFDETMRVNLRGYLVCTRAAVPALLERGGSIIYTSSPAALKGEPIRLAYAVAKAGVEALMRHVANRYGAAGIRANCIAPGTTLHERVESLLDEPTRDWLRSMAIIKSRFGRPEDIAAMAALLMSDEGSYITAQVIGVDGGVTMRS